MSNLLIHSMSEFAGIILGCLEAAGARNVAEIGSEYGGMSQVLARHCQAAGGILTSIDPAPKPGFLDWVADSGAVDHVAAMSLAAIPTLPDIDAWVIDGDHNYYTVFNELTQIDAVNARTGRPLLAILHDVGWPWGRRDLYYAPATIPAEHRHPCDAFAGVTLDNVMAVPDRGFRGNGEFSVALREGGPRNGVLTAIEDFVAATSIDGREFAFAFIPGVFGLGVLFDTTAAWAGDVASLIAPLDNHPLIASLEENRLRNYLKVIEMQDARTW